MRRSRKSGNPEQPKPSLPPWTPAFAGATKDKHPATPAAVYPARELLADLLLELKQPDAALKEYEQVLRTDPNRFRSLLGKARAAKQSGDAATSREAYQKLAALSKSAGSERPELSEANAFPTN